MTHKVIRFKLRNVFTKPIIICGAERQSAGSACQRCALYKTPSDGIMVLNEGTDSNFELGFDQLFTLTQVRIYCDRNHIHLGLKRFSKLDKQVMNRGISTEDIDKFVASMDNIVSLVNEASARVGIDPEKRAELRGNAERFANMINCYWDEVKGKIVVKTTRTLVPNLEHIKKMEELGERLMKKLMSPQKKNDDADGL